VDVKVTRQYIILYLKPTFTDCIGAQSKDRGCDVPPQEKSPILRDIRKVELQFWEAFPLAGKEIGWVSVICL
jgi:hypothetical protein